MLASKEARLYRRQLNKDKPLPSRIVSGMLIVVSYALLLLAILVALPVNYGGIFTIAIISGNSMEPNYSHADAVLLISQSEYELGDVIAYRVPEESAGGGRVIFHRLVDIESDGSFRTQGDNRNSTDQWRIPQEDVLGASFIHFPNLGDYFMRINSPLGLAIVAGLLILLFLWPTKEPDPIDTVFVSDEDLLPLDGSSQDTDSLPSERTVVSDQIVSGSQEFVPSQYSSLAQMLAVAASSQVEHAKHVGEESYQAGSDASAVLPVPDESSSQVLPPPPPFPPVAEEAPPLPPVTETVSETVSEPSVQIPPPPVKIPASAVPPPPVSVPPVSQKVPSVPFETATHVHAASHVVSPSQVELCYKATVTCPSCDTSMVLHIDQLPPPYPPPTV